jgi:hypothetical protein
MTRKKPSIRARPIRGVLTSDAEYTEQLRRWHIEAMFTLLVAEGFSLSDFEALSAHPETNANFWFETALHFASKCHSRLKVPPLRNVVWHQGKLHDLMADFWFEERRCPGSEREITGRLAVTPEYATRWGDYTSDTLRDRLQDAKKEPFIRVIESEPTGVFRAAFLELAALLSATPLHSCHVWKEQMGVWSFQNRPGRLP